MSEEEITLPLALVRAVFDVAVESMDFGSGFLEDDEVEALRRLAEHIGVDPAVATPENFRVKYRVPLDDDEVRQLEMLQGFLATGDKSPYEKHFYEERLKDLESRPRPEQR